MAHTDALGRAVSPTEERILALYQEVKAILEQEDLAPCARDNLKCTLSHIWQIVNDLDLEFEQLYDKYGV